MLHSSRHVRLFMLAGSRSFVFCRNTRRIKIYVLGGNIFIAKITCHLRITSGLYWLADRYRLQFYSSVEPLPFGAIIGRTCT